MAEIPHLRLPLALAADGDFAVVEQDSPDDVAQQVRALCRTPLGWSDELTDMGLTEQAFIEGGADPEEIEAQISEHVPGFAGAVDEAPDVMDEAVRHVGVRLVDRG